VGIGTQSGHASTKVALGLIGEPKAF
jgi:hypothetical protein